MGTWRRAPAGRRRAGVAARNLIFVAAAVGGCHEFPDVTIDDLPPSGLTSTSSADHVRSLQVAGAERSRGFEPMTVDAQDGTVSHGPLWLDDPAEVLGDGNADFAVTYADWVQVPWSMGRFMANVLLMPVSMVFERPGTVMCSDGRSDTGCDCRNLCARDAKRCSGVTEPPDTHDTWGSGVETAVSEETVEPAPASQSGGVGAVVGDE